MFRVETFLSGSARNPYMAGDGGPLSICKINRFLVQFGLQRENIRVLFPCLHKLVHPMMHRALAKIWDLEACSECLQATGNIAGIAVNGNIGHEYISRWRRTPRLFA